MKITQYTNLVEHYIARKSKQTQKNMLLSYVGSEKKKIKVKGKDEVRGGQGRVMEGGRDQSVLHEIVTVEPITPQN
jgi:hypothetical protein